MFRKSGYVTGDNSVTALPLFDQVFSGPPKPPKRRLTGEDLRDSGIESVLSHTPEDYKERFMQAVKSFPVGHLITR